MHASTNRPWGIGRMRPYPTVHQQPYTSVTVDPASQRGVFRDSRGQLVELGKHGTLSGTETSPESTALDGVNDTDHDQDSTPD